MPLARSMTLGFIPCVGAAALAYVIFEQDRWVRVARLAVAGGCCPDLADMAVEKRFLRMVVSV